VLVAEGDKPVADLSQKGREAKQHAVEIAQGGDEA
jgi:hypothetical protein